MSSLTKSSESDAEDGSSAMGWRCGWGNFSADSRSGLGGFFADAVECGRVDRLRHDDAEDEASLRVVQWDQLEVAAGVNEQAHGFDRIANFPVEGHAAGGEMEMGAAFVVKDAAVEVDHKNG